MTLMLKCAMTYDLSVNFLLRWCNDGIGVFVIYITVCLYVVVAASCFSTIICHYEGVIRVNNIARYMLSMTVITKTYTGIFLLGQGTFKLLT